MVSLEKEISISLCPEYIAQYFGDTKVKLVSRKLILRGKFIWFFFKAIQYHYQQIFGYKNYPRYGICFVALALKEFTICLQRQAADPRLICKRAKWYRH